jgi:hypothetical protein
MPERPLGSWVELDDLALVVHGEDAVQRPLQGGALAYLALADRLLRARPLDELADLLTDRGDREDQVQIGRTDLVTVKLHHAEQLVAALNREGEGPAQPRGGGRLSAGGVLILEDVGERNRLAALPDPAG